MFKTFKLKIYIIIFFRSLWIKNSLFQIWQCIYFSFSPYQVLNLSLSHSLFHILFWVVSYFVNYCPFSKLLRDVGFQDISKLRVICRAIYNTLNQFFIDTQSSFIYSSIIHTCFLCKYKICDFPGLSHRLWDFIFYSC